METHNPKALIKPLLAGIGTAIATAAMWQLAVLAVNTVGRSSATWVVVTWSLASLTVPIVVGAMVARYLFVGGRSSGHPQPAAVTPRASARARAGRIRLPRAALIVVAVLYGLTWAAGAPAVQTALTHDVLQQVSGLRSTGGQAYDVPRIKTAVSFPLFPGVLVAYHERQIAGMNGWGGWVVYGCGPTGVREICRITVWVS